MSTAHYEFLIRPGHQTRTHCMQPAMISCNCQITSPSADLSSRKTTHCLVVLASSPVFPDFKQRPSAINPTTANLQIPAPQLPSEQHDTQQNDPDITEQSPLSHQTAYLEKQRLRRTKCIGSTTPRKTRDILQL